MRTPEHDNRRKVIAHFSHKKAQKAQRTKKNLWVLFVAKFDLYPRFDIEKLHQIQTTE
jgi:hypothetical protein